MHYFLIYYLYLKAKLGNANNELLLVGWETIYGVSYFSILAIVFLRLQFSFALLHVLKPFIFHDTRSFYSPFCFILL